MTLDELKQKEDKIKIIVDAWDNTDCDIAYVYLYRAYYKRISDCEKRLARMLFEGTG